jgi:hypothetical protein
MTEDNLENTEFAGICRSCGSNVNVIKDMYGTPTYQCENTKCEYNEGEESDSDPEWVD